MKKIILASASPRRSEILKEYDLEIDIIPADVGEIVRLDEKPEQIAMALAFEKAYSVSLNIKDQVILAADTIVVLGNKILGKPRDRQEAFEMLMSLSGKEHRVVTGISIIKGNKKIIDYESTLVKFRELSSEQIIKYIDTKEPMDKAGAYGIQGYGKILVEKINGSYSNVVGLPIVKTDFLLTRFFDIQIL